MRNYFNSEFSQINTYSDEFDGFIEFIHNFTLVNFEKLDLLKIRKISKLNKNELTDYKINLQTTFSHENFCFIENDTKLLLQINNCRIYEVDEKNLDDTITKLKEIYNKIKI